MSDQLARTADVKDSVKPGTSAAENAELRAAEKRIRLLEQEKRVPQCPASGRRQRDDAPRPSNVSLKTAVMFIQRGAQQRTWC